METKQDFEDLLHVFEQHGVRYMVIGGLAFTFHAKPRYTKDIDLWVDSSPENLRRVNEALDEFGSPHFFDPEAEDADVLQLGVPPNRVDLLLDPASSGGPSFEEALGRAERSRYGEVEASWISAEDLLDIKSRIDHPRHQEDARVLRMVLEMQSEDG